MLIDGYVKYEEAEVHRSAIMQDSDPFSFYNCEICHGLSVTHYILFYILGPASLLFFQLSKYHKIINI